MADGTTEAVERLRRSNDRGGLTGLHRSYELSRPGKHRVIQRLTIGPPLFHQLAEDVVGGVTGILVSLLGWPGC